jgi:cytochrome c oxidase assembly protein subunit 15
MGFVFLFPFLFFWWRKMLPQRLMRQLAWVILTALLAATFGWLMVWTGIKGNPLTNPRAWVNAYALSGHLIIGFSVFSTLWWATIWAWQGEPPIIHNPPLKRLAYLITGVTLLQIVFGGWMSGMKAGLLYPTFPLMNGEIIPTILYDVSQWTTTNLTQYDKNGFAPTLIQILHRFTA